MTIYYNHVVWDSSNEMLRFYLGDKEVENFEYDQVLDLVLESREKGQHKLVEEL